MSATHIRFNDDDDNEEYELSASDDEEDQQLLKNLYNKKDKVSDSEEEVYGVGSDSEDASNESDLAISDVEQDDRDDLPDVRAWGKDKRKFYSTDYVDPDYGGFQGKDATLAELEEEEAKNLQKQLIGELDDNDFSLDIFANKKIDEVKKPKEEIVKTDVSKLSKRQKLEILQKESPEFFGLIEDYKNRMSIAKEFLLPIVKLAKQKKLPKSNALDFVNLNYQHILNYCTNIYMYLLLKLSRVNIKNHPVAKRLYQYRTMLSKFDSIFESTIKPQVEIILQENDTLDNLNPLQKSKTLEVLKKLAKRNIEDEEKVRNKEENSLEPPLKKNKLEVHESSESDDSGMDENDEKSEENQTDEMEKRAITYQMAKNKGLTPYRKKEQRNPRVKHRNKFRKAKISRKGAVREVRKELKRYGGEISGIKASVSKSIKIK